jgi:hypothetical protein
MDGVTFSLNPQVHASDDATLVETLEAQRDVVWSARQFCGALPICVGPVTLRPRFNPDATGPVPFPKPGELPPSVDPRQCQLLTAAWTLGSLGELATSGAARLTYYETTGWRGVMETESGSPLPEQFPSVAGGVYPVYHVFADLGEVAGAEIAVLDFGRPLEVRGVALRGGSLRVASPSGEWLDCAGTRLFIANVSRKVQEIPLPPAGRFGGESFCVRVLDESNVFDAMRDPEGFRANSGKWSGDTDLVLGPYATACVDAVGDRT